MKFSVCNNIKNWFLYPPELRISRREYTDISELSNIKRLQSIPHTLSNMKHDEDFLDIAVDIGTLVWRVQKRLNAMGELPKELKRVSRDIEAAWIALTQRGVEIEDHTGKEYASGMMMKVVASQPVATLRSESIIETLKPTIYHKDKMIQMGEVVVGFPETNPSLHQR